MRQNTYMHNNTYEKYQTEIYTVKTLLKVLRLNKKKVYVVFMANAFKLKRNLVKIVKLTYVYNM